MPIRATPPPAIEQRFYTYLGRKQLMSGGGGARMGMGVVGLLGGRFG